MELKVSTQELLSLKKELSGLVPGRLVKRHGYLYRKSQGRFFGLTRNLEAQRQLCRRSLISKRAIQLEKAVTLIEKALKEAPPMNYHDLLRKIKKKNRALDELPVEYFYHPGALQWLKEEYVSNPYSPEQLVYRTNNNVLVRSMSELAIANKLEASGLLYRYECEITLDGKTFYTDFVILNPFNGKIYYWEHFGALHLPGYTERMYDKVGRYKVAGFELICSFERDIKTPGRIEEIIADILR